MELTNVESGFLGGVQASYGGEVESGINRSNYLRVSVFSVARDGIRACRTTISQNTEDDIGVRFPHDFRLFLRSMNGTDLTTLNIYAQCGEPPRTSVGVYSYPRDLGIVKQRIEDIRESRDEIHADLTKQGFELSAEAHLVPIYGHRYLVCTADLNRSVVLSVVVHSADAIVYGNSLREYLEHEFLGDSL